MWKHFSLALLCLYMTNSMEAQVLGQNTFVPKAPYYRCITLRTNILSWFNLAVEAPVYNHFTLEASGRTYSAVGFWAYVSMTDVRTNIKYNFPLYSARDNRSSVYVYSGLHFLTKYRKSQITEDIYEEDQLDASRLVAGAGMRKRRIDLWVAFEYTFDTHINRSSYYEFDQEPFRHETWKPDYGVSAGLAINLFNIRI